VKESRSRTVGRLVDAFEQVRARIRVLGGVTVASLVAAVIVLVVGSPFVGRVGGDPAFAGNSLAQTVQDLTVVCTVPELHGRSSFLLSYSPNFTGPNTYPASLGASSGNANHGTALAYILSATENQYQQKGVSVDQNRCRNTSTFVPLTHAGLPGPPDRLHGFTCIARGQLLIRARAAWDHRGLAASLAVRSYATRKPVAFGFINRTGFGGLYTSRGCVRRS
jgi:hypothetical protein